MNTHYLSGAVLAGMALMGCQPDMPKLITHNNFENLEANTPAPPWLTTEKAHSGKHAAMVRPGIGAAATYRSTWADLGSPKELQVKSWVYITDRQSMASIVVQIDRDGKTIHWDELKFQETARHFNQWLPMQKLFVLPADLQPNDYVKVFLGKNDPHGPVFMDDFTIEKAP